MNIARTLSAIRQGNVRSNFHRKLQLSAIKHTQASQNQVQEEKFDFEDLKVHERVERRKPQIPPFMKNVFVSTFNNDLLAYPEILNKEEATDLERRVETLEKVFSDPGSSRKDRINVMKGTYMFSAPVSLTRNGLAANHTESLRYLETISSDFQLGQILSDHWVGLEALRLGLTQEQYNGVIDDLITGDKTIALCIKERLAERVSQADFRTASELDGEGIWRISGEKVCHKTNGYMLVVATVEGSRLKAFLVHPGTQGVSHDGTFVTFLKTPATPLDMVTEGRLAAVLSISRLHAAVLCRCRLRLAMKTVVEYVRPRALSGKPLAELATIRVTVGEAMLNVYASESAEYFTAGLLDGYVDPDAELEAAMCRNYISQHGVSAMLQLLSIPALDKELECRQLFEDMRSLAVRGESLDAINMFIALNGIQHAGKMMAGEVKHMRNPLMNPGFIFKKVLANRLQEKDEPKLTLYLAEHLHPSLKTPAEHLEYCVLRMRYACETLMARHGGNIVTAYTEMTRLAAAASEVLVMAAVLARASRSYCIGLRNAEVEMKLAACFVEKSKNEVKRLIKEIDDGQYINLDHFKCQFGQKVLDSNTAIVETPIARTFW